MNSNDYHAIVWLPSVREIIKQHSIKRDLQDSMLPSKCERGKNFDTIMRCKIQVWYHKSYGPGNCKLQFNAFLFRTEPTWQRSFILNHRAVNYEDSERCFIKAPCMWSLHFSNYLNREMMTLSALQLLVSKNMITVHSNGN